MTMELPASSRVRRQTIESEDQEGAADAARWNLTSPPAVAPRAVAARPAIWRRSSSSASLCSEETFSGEMPSAETCATEVSADWATAASALAGSVPALGGPGSASPRNFNASRVPDAAGRRNVISPRAAPATVTVYQTSEATGNRGSLEISNTAAGPEAFPETWVRTFWKQVCHASHHLRISGRSSGLDFLAFASGASVIIHPSYFSFHNSPAEATGSSRVNTRAARCALA